MKVLQGSAFEVLKTLPEESVDVVYTAPSPFAYYKDQPEKIGGKPRPVDYINDLVNLCKECYSVLKPSGSLFIQLGDQFTKHGDLMGIPCNFENWMITSHFDDSVYWKLNDRLIWHRKENLSFKYKERGFLKNYEFIFHFVKDLDKFYFNTNSKYIRSSVHSYAIEDSYFTNEFDSGLPEQLTQIIIDTSCPPKGTILDPLAGTGKVGVVAKKMNRDAILIDIDFETCERIKTRLGLQ